MVKSLAPNDLQHHRYAELRQNLCCVKDFTGTFRDGECALEMWGHTKSAQTTGCALQVASSMESLSLLQ